MYLYSLVVGVVVIVGTYQIRFALDVVDADTNKLVQFLKYVELNFGDGIHPTKVVLENGRGCEIE